ncbi:methyl-accepting chemotaxis protein [Alkalibacillus haloalkaliphilus]|uniref:Methyl-accepting chemotaxis protein n=1 Tax=Alkalibacillus haloalkaliphilus TaxID=94136 RepID=A0A511W7H6_9BACI|nr:methyl-accepting chemotaxis protein [Alkalibacillus haloalkaliphilus]GEN45342.1 methyl-accepting chemotaxis protein [Alkalibacillus haloalkaliphilus]
MFEGDMRTVEQQSLHNKNKLLFWLLLIITAVSTIANISSGLPTSVIFTVLFGGLGILAIAGFLVFTDKATHVVPYIYVIGLSALLGFIVLEASVSTHNFGLIFFILVTSAIYMSLPLLIIGFTSSMAIYHSLVIMHGDLLDLRYETALSFILFTAIILFGLQRITKQTDDQLEQLRHENELRFQNEAKQKEHIEKQTTIIKNSMEEIESQSDTNSQALTEMNRAIQEIASSTETQADDLTSINDSIHQTASNMDNMMNHLNDIQENTNETSRQAQTGKEESDQMIDQIKTFESSMDQMRATFKDLTEKVESSASFIQSIKEINEQTGLLALNASIEAARAGEHGKGFAVVADEIRKLADHTDKTASNISDNLHEMKQTNEETDEQMNQLLSVLQDNIKTIHQSSERFNQFEDDTNDLQNKLNQFSHTAEQVNESTLRINDTMEQIASKVQQTTASVEEITATVQEQTNQNTQLHEEIEKTTEALQQLTKESST